MLSVKSGIQHMSKNGLIIFSPPDSIENLSCIYLRPELDYMNKHRE